MFLAWVVYPLVLLALCTGLGLLVDALSGRRLPGALVVPVGLAAIVVVGQFTTLADATAELTVPVLLVLAIAGAALSLPWRFGRPDPWAAGVALAVFAVFGAPVILSGEPTFAGYIKLDDTATWLALTDRVMEHGRSLDGLEISTYRSTLEFNLASGYPVGVFLPFGAAAKLTGAELAWVFQPYVSFLAAMLALALWQILGEVPGRDGSGVGEGPLRRPGWRALAATVAAQPALLFGYALWGGVKEVATAAALALAAALAPAILRASDIRPSGVGSKSDALRGTLPLAVAAGALIGLLSFGGLVWIGPMLLALGALAAHRLGGRAAATLAAGFALLLALCALPILIDGGFSPFQSTLTEERELGNLIEPLRTVQALGIWPAGDFRVDPDGTVATAVLVALGLFAAAVGLWFAASRRQVALLLYASSLIAAAAIVVVASPWVGGKALATAAPALLALAIAGALFLLRVDRLTGAALIAVVAGGVLWSNLLAYGSADLAPYDQLAELEQIGEDFAGQGPALMTEYNPYGARHFLRELDAEGASELRSRAVYLNDGGSAEKGEAVDTDEVARDSLLEYRTLVLRRSPVRSRPPSPYRLAWSGDSYEVWQRPAVPTALPPERLPLGEGLEPAAVPDCGEIGGLGLVALNNGVRGVSLLAARHAPVVDATSGDLFIPRTGVYEAWLKGSVRGGVELFVDEERIGAARHALENDGGFIPLGEVSLERGRHGAALRFGGADLHPGSGGFPRPETGPLLFVPAGEEAGEIVSVPLDRAGELCGKRWDWIEAVGGG